VWPWAVPKQWLRMRTRVGDHLRDRQWQWTLVLGSLPPTVLGARPPRLKAQPQPYQQEGPGSCLSCPSAIQEEKKDQNLVVLRKASHLGPLLSPSHSSSRHGYFGDSQELVSAEHYYMHVLSAYLQTRLLAAWTTGSRGQGGRAWDHQEVLRTSWETQSQKQKTRGRESPCLVQFPVPLSPWSIG
jgi:hypothetical protein